MTHIGFVPDIIPCNKGEGDIIPWEYTCSSRKYVDEAVSFHKKNFSGEEYQPIKVKLIQFRDWVDGNKGVWIVRITNRNYI